MTGARRQGRATAVRGQTLGPISRVWSRVACGSFALLIVAGAIPAEAELPWLNGHRPQSTVPESTPREAVGGTVSARVRLGLAWLEARLDHELVPGAGLAITEPGVEPLVIGLGTADLEVGRPAGGDTPFRAGSISKLFTALTVLSLAQEEVLSLDDEVQATLDFLPQQTAVEQRITLRQLLNHTSGLAEEAQIPYFIEFNFPEAPTLRASTASFASLSTPGAEYRYSNLGYALLGLAAETIAQRPFAELLRERVLRPLGMEATTLDGPRSESSASSGASPERGPTEELARGYGIRSATGRQPFAPYRFEALSPAGGLVTTAADLARLTSWMGGTLSRPDTTHAGPVSRSSLLAMTRRPDPEGPGRRGLGVGFYSSPRGTDFVGHGGYCAGYRSILLVEPESGRGLSLLLNVNDVSPLALASSLYDLIYGEPYVVAGEFGSDLDRFEGVYDRTGMPERYAIAAVGDTLEVISLFSEEPIESLEVLTHEGEGTFRAPDGRLVRFDRESTGSPLRFWIQDFHYLTRVAPLPVLRANPKVEP